MPDLTPEELAALPPDEWVRVRVHAPHHELPPRDRLPGESESAFSYRWLMLCSKEYGDRNRALRERANRYRAVALVQNHYGGMTFAVQADRCEAVRLEFSEFPVTFSRQGVTPPASGASDPAHTS